MKVTKEPDALSVDFKKQLYAVFSKEEVASFFLTVLGMSDLAHKFIWEKVKDFMQIPIEVRYSLLQHVSFCRMMAKLDDNNLKSEEFHVSYMPVGEDSWKTEEDFEKRFIFIVKAFYDELKKEGKI